MALTFARDGISFRYPENWRVEESDHAGGWAVTLESPGASFLTMSVHDDPVLAEQLADTALTALRDDYPKLEAEAVAELFAGQPAVGYDVRFFSLDLTNFCFIRGFDSEAGTVLVLGQATDSDDLAFDVLKAVSASLRVEELSTDEPG